MDAGPFDEFHDARNEDLLPVTDSIDFDFLAADVAVHENRFVLIDFHGALQIFPKRFLLRNNLHRTAAENKARAD